MTAPPKTVSDFSTNYTAAENVTVYWCPLDNTGGPTGDKDRGIAPATPRTVVTACNQLAGRDAFNGQEELFAQGLELSPLLQPNERLVHVCSVKTRIGRR